MLLKYYLLHWLLHKLGERLKKIKKGVIKKPPPTPKSPERIPTIPLSERIASMFTETSAIGKKTSIELF